MKLSCIVETGLATLKHAADNQNDGDSSTWKMFDALISKSDGM
jgi:hypothetical protein